MGQNPHGGVVNDKRSEETIYTYTWTPKEGRALLRRLQAYLKKQRDRKRRWRAKRRAEGEPT